MVDIEKTTSAEVLTLKVAGEVDASSSIEVDQAIAKAMEENPSVVLFDLSGLDYISSAGLGVFMSYLEEFKSREIKSAIYGLNPKVRKVFDILGLDQLMAIVEDEEKALAEVK